MSKKPTYRPDSKGRISLGKLAKGVDAFIATIQPDLSIKLTPYIRKANA
jgi:hypothetical protein